MSRDALAPYRTAGLAGRWRFRAERLLLRGIAGAAPALLGAAIVLDDWLRAFWHATDDDQALAVWYEAPRGFAKTTTAGALGVERVVLRPEHDVLVFASDREQAGLLKREAEGFVERDRKLAAEIEVTRDGLRCRATRSELRVLASDAAGNYGYGARSFTAIFDEFWAQPSRDLWDAAASALPKVPGCQIITLTNAGAIGSAAWEVRELHRLASDPAFRFFAPHLDGAWPSWMDRGDLVRQRRLLPDRQFRRLWLGDWLSGDDLAFLASAIAACTIEQESAWRREGAVALGVDLAKAHDFSVVVALDLVTGEIRDLWRERGVEFTEVARVVVDARRRWGPGPLLVDETGLGAPVLDVIAEQLGHGYRRLSHRDAGDGGGVRDVGRAVYGFALGNDVKTRLVRKLQVDLERRRLKIPRRFGVLLDELRKFRETYTTTGRPQFGNPTGSDEHDDTVIALALAAFALTDETRSAADPVLRKIAAAELRDLAVAVNPLLGRATAADSSFRCYRAALRDRARLERKRTLGLVSDSEYRFLASRELPWPGWTEFDAAHSF